VNESGRLWKIGPHELIIENRLLQEFLMDSVLLACEVLIIRANDNTAMGPYARVQFDEMTAIPSQDRPMLRNGECQDVGIAHFLSSLTCFLDR
jgi:hypothetical protein